MIIEDLIKTDPKFFINFDLYCQKGENDTQLCTLIRQDSIEEFIIFINKHNISISKFRIKPSIFETNPVFHKSNPSLIEYAAFYGSIQIFQYLDLNEATLSSKCWLYGIHSNNAEIIHILEQKEIVISNVKIYKEAIKCHHNDIANYIYDNLMNENEKKTFESDELKFNIHRINADINSYEYKYFNFLFFPKTFENQIQLYYASFYDHINIVKLFLESKDWDFNADMIFFIIFF